MSVGVIAYNNFCIYIVQQVGINVEARMGA